MRTRNFINQLEGIARYKAFVPNVLPFDFQITPKLLSKLSEADISLGRLDTVSDVLPDVDFFILMYVRKEATLSSQIEGTQATFVDVLKAEAKIEDFEVHKDVDEVLNYVDAMNYGIERAKELPLSLRLIKKIHKVLLKGVRGEARTPGEFRRSQNWVGGRTIQTAKYIPPPENYVQDLMCNLETYIHDTTFYPILLKTGIMHAQFETIHPFLDGNGRIGRLLITYVLCQKQVLQKPLLYLSEFFNNRKADYYEKLNAYREEDAIEEWLEFYLEGVIETTSKAVDTARKIRKLHDKNRDSIVGLGRLALNAEKVYKTLFRTPIIRVRDVEHITKLTNPNAINLINRLEGVGILKEITGKSRYKIYSFQEYVNLFS